MPDTTGTDRGHRHLGLTGCFHRLDFTLVGGCLLGAKDPQRGGQRPMLNDNRSTGRSCQTPLARIVGTGTWA